MVVVGLLRQIHPQLLLVIHPFDKFIMELRVHEFALTLPPVRSACDLPRIGKLRRDHNRIGWPGGERRSHWLRLFSGGGRLGWSRGSEGWPDGRGRRQVRASGDGCGEGRVSCPPHQIESED